MIYLCLICSIKDSERIAEQLIKKEYREVRSYSSDRLPNSRCNIITSEVAKALKMEKAILAEVNVREQGNNYEYYISKPYCSRKSFTFIDIIAAEQIKKHYGEQAKIIYFACKNDEIVNKIGEHEQTEYILKADTVIHGNNIDEKINKLYEYIDTYEKENKR